MRIINSKKAQASVEYLLVIAGALAILVPFVMVFLSQSRASKMETTRAELEYIGNDLMQQAEYLYNTGGFSKRTLNYQLPNNVISINITPELKELTFYFQGEQRIESISFFSQVPLQSGFTSLNNFTRFVLFNKEGYVMICITDPC